jgi:hypothetical protein
MHQALAAYVIKQPGNQPLVSGWVAGRVLSSDAELFAIRSAVVRATMLDNCDHIIVFTDSLTAAWRAVDLSSIFLSSFSFLVSLTTKKKTKNKKKIFLSVADRIAK